MPYDPNAIESRWQQYWEANKSFRAAGPGEPGFDSAKPKYYVLDMFPYPSGDGLHVGHPEGYTATDVLARYRRMKGYNVLHPMGWDAFGLPAEQGAIESGRRPAEITRERIARFKKQIQSLGYSYDWDRELSTTDENYYKWTQWIFARLYEKGLAYITSAPVWWCEALGTVLANEEVIDGRSERGDHPCERRPLKQWMLKITAYAERLLSDLDELNWPEKIKAMQRHWIGKSEGAEVDFTVVGADSKPGAHKIRVFTTRPDTLYGATYMVLAPEHPLVGVITTRAQATEVTAYQMTTARKTDLLRTDLAKEKTGVFTGAYALNPVNGEEIPIWIADYVLVSYGTGAIMAVPAHDTRDFEFARQFHLPIRSIMDPIFESLSISEIPGFGVAPGKSAGGQTCPDTPAIRQVLKDKVLMGDACWIDDGVLTNSPPDSAASDPARDINGLPVEEAKAKITAYLQAKGVGEKKITYRLRDWLFSRQRYWGEPFPLVQDAQGNFTLLPDSALPVTLPPLDDFLPTGQAEPPLTKATAWLNTTHPVTGAPVKRETNTMPQWAGSCWYYLRFLDPHNSAKPWDATKEKYWMSVDLYVGGAEHAVLHLLYARFWHKVLFDLGYVSTKEPFKQLFNQGMIQAFAYRDKETKRLVVGDKVEERDEKFFNKEDGHELEQFVAKMSKSLKNVVNPDEVINEFGADTLRLYELFMGPLEASKPWNPRDVPGCRRFLDRLWRLFIGEDPQHGPPATIRATCAKGSKTPDEPEIEKALHRAIKKVGADFESMNFNTAVSTLMSLVNTATPLAEKMSHRQACRLALVVAPLAPHLGEELWHRLGHSTSLTYEPWPTYDEAMCSDATIEIPVQLNGKLKGRIVMAKDAAQAEILIAAKKELGDALAGLTIKREIYVAGRMVNIVAGK
ncbi:MAG TPA: leucine--tRNA ligase [Planctomycetota bacterium]|nr:leucine--tRNA ligase [Planctomycetota bacterium]